MRDFIFIRSVLHVLYLDSFFALQDAKAALWLMGMEWPSPREPGALPGALLLKGRREYCLYFNYLTYYLVAFCSLALQLVYPTAKCDFKSMGSPFRVFLAVQCYLSVIRCFSLEKPCHCTRWQGLLPRGSCDKVDASFQLL